MLVLVDGSLDSSKYTRAQHKRANGMDLMENSNKLINFAPSICELKIHTKKKTEHKNISYKIIYVRT
jgi:hypothetical protein